MSNPSTVADLRDALSDLDNDLRVFPQLVAHDYSAWTVSVKCAEYLDAVTEDGVFLFQVTHPNLDTLKDDSVPHQCRWEYDLHGDSWDTECGEKFWFEGGGPSENKFHHCPYCGGSLTTAS